MAQEKNKNQQEIKSLKVYSLILTIFVVILLVKTFVTNSNQLPDVIRVQGIIVEDVNGKERILIGAPVPYATNRVRTDSVRAKKSWGFIHPDYMKFYKDFDHSANGIIILDDKGYDRIAIGNNTPDPNIGARIAPSSGIAINDENGFERSGYGILKVNGVNRVNLGMDTNKGTEGMVLSVDDDGTTGISIRGKKQNIFLGKADTLNWGTRYKFPYNGLLIEYLDSTKYNFNTYRKAINKKK